MNATTKPVTGKTKQKAYEKPQKPIVVDSQVMIPQTLVPRKTNTWVAWAVFAVTLLVYMLTQARTMSFWDSGEYATCISILGVPHPPGNPFYILFGRAFISLFGWIASDAVLAAFISCLTSAFAVMFTYLITVKLSSMFRIKASEAIFAGVIAAMFTAFSFTFWMNAIEAEVYSGLVFFVNLIFWITLIWLEKSREYDHQNLLLLIIYLFFLGFCVHQTALQIAPAMLFIVVYPMLQTGVKKSNFWVKVIGYTALVIGGYAIFGAIGKGIMVDDFDKWGFALVTLFILYFELKDIIDKRVWGLAIFLVLLGMSSHLFLMVRAADRPFINEGTPSTLSTFSDYVLRKQYGQTSFMVRRSSFFSNQFGFHFLRYFSMQWFNAEGLAAFSRIPANFFSWLGALIIASLGVIGGWFHLKQNRHSFRYFLVVLLFTTVIMVFVMNLSDAEVRDRDYFFVVAYNMWAIWLGIGSLALVHFTRSKAAKTALLILLAALPLVNLVSQYNLHDRSKEYIALDYGVNFLNSLEENAIIFTNGDNDTFPLWYAQAVADPHAKELIHKASGIYPTAESQAAIRSAMEYKNKYLKGIRKDVSIANLSLLNTPWYVHQLRDKEGILFNLDKDSIDKMDYDMQRNAKGDAFVFRAEPENHPELAFGFEFGDPPAWRQDQGLIRSDLAVMQIIKDNFGKRPIYFAVTCQSYIGFEEFTRNEGMVARVVHTKGMDQLGIQRLLQNIDSVYQYRSIGDARVYKDANMKSLVQNYGSGFAKAAQYYVAQGDYKKALSYAERAKKFIDNEVKLSEFYIAYYSALGKWDDLDKFIQRNILPQDRGPDIYVSYVILHMMEKHPSKTLEYIEKGMLLYPGEEVFAQVAAQYTQDLVPKADVVALFDRMKSTLLYNLQPYYNLLNDPGTLDSLAM